MGFFNSIVRDIKNSAAVISQNQIAPAMNSNNSSISSYEGGDSFQEPDLQNSAVSNQSLSDVDSDPGKNPNRSIKDSHREVSSGILNDSTESEVTTRMESGGNYEEPTIVINDNVELSGSFVNLDNEVVDHDSTESEVTAKKESADNDKEPSIVINDNVEVPGSSVNFDNEIVEYDSVKQNLDTDNQIVDSYTPEVDLQDIQRNIDENIESTIVDKGDSVESMDVSIPDVSIPVNVIDEDVLSGTNDVVSASESHYLKQQQNTNKIKAEAGEDSGVPLDNRKINKIQESGIAEYRFKDTNDGLDSVENPDVEDRNEYRVNNKSNKSNSSFNDNEVHKIGGETPGVNGLVLKDNNKVWPDNSVALPQVNSDNRVIKNSDNSEQSILKSSPDPLSLDSQQLVKGSKTITEMESGEKRIKRNEIYSKRVIENKAINYKGQGSEKGELIPDVNPENNNRTVKKSDDKKAFGINDIDKSEKIAQEKNRILSKVVSDARKDSERSKTSRINESIAPNVVIGVIDITVETPLQTGSEAKPESINFDFASRNYLRRL